MGYCISDHCSACQCTPYKRRGVSSASRSSDVSRCTARTAIEGSGARTEVRALFSPTVISLVQPRQGISPTPSIVPSFSQMCPPTDRSEDTVGRRGNYERVAVYRRVVEDESMGGGEEENGFDHYKVTVALLTGSVIFFSVRHGQCSSFCSSSSSSIDPFYQNSSARAREVTSTTDSTLSLSQSESGLHSQLIHAIRTFYSNPSTRITTLHLNSLCLLF